MNIKITNADFSANGDNIGREDLRTAPSASTQTLLDYYGKTWTLAQQLKIEDFLIKKSAWTFGSKVKKLVLPTLAPISDLPKADTTPISFYDLITETVQTVSFGGAVSSATPSRFIGANGFYDNGGALNANDFFAVNLGAPTSWDNIHLGMYFKTNENDIVEIAGDMGFVNINMRTNQAYLGNSGNRITAEFDPNSYTTRGLRIVSYDGTNITGSSANLPFASVSGSGFPDGATGDMNLRLLSRYTAVDATVGLISFGDALTQAESDIYNADINELMDALWSE